MGYADRRSATDAEKTQEEQMKLKMRIGQILDLSYFSISLSYFPKHASSNFVEN